MCGFAGVIGFSPELSKPEVKAQLEGMGDVMAARGPDDAAYHMDDTLCLVFRRLSIVDVEGGQQPLWNEDHTLLVVANGEIYNHLELRQHLKDEHRFRTRSDCEIIVHLWEEQGPDALSLLNGIFAIAVWDTTSKTLYLARDRLGVKPLFYTRTGSLFLFGSVLRALLMHPACPRDLNLISINRVDESPIAGIKSLPGGQLAILSPRGPLKVQTYWSIQDHFDYGASPTRSADDYVEQYAALLEDAVRGRLMSDVPVGVFLSGGLDSSVVTALAARTNKEIKCFNIYDEEDDSGDRDAAEKLAQREGLELFQTSLAAKQLVSPTLRDFEQMLWNLEGPIVNAETSSKLFAYRQAKRTHPEMKVVLLGQGADEFAGGYSMGQAPSWSGFLRAQLKRLVMDTVFRVMREDALPAPDHCWHEYATIRVQQLQDYNLWHEDRMSASQSIEARVPFLDHRLVELLASVPMSLHEELFWDKQIERRAAERWLPSEFIHRKKIGFIQGSKTDQVLAKQAQGICALIPEFTEKYLSSSDSIFAQDRIRKVFERHEAYPSAQQLVERIVTIMQFVIFWAQCQRPQDFLYLMEDPVRGSVVAGAQ